MIKRYQIIHENCLYPIVQKLKQRFRNFYKLTVSYLGLLTAYGFLGQFARRFTLSERPLLKFTVRRTSTASKDTSSNCRQSWDLNWKWVPCVQLFSLQLENSLSPDLWPIQPCYFYLFVAKFMTLRALLRVFTKWRNLKWLAVICYFPSFSKVHEGGWQSGSK